MFDSEVHEAMHPAPLLGTSGDETVDLFLSSAEQAYGRARAGALQLKPLILQGSEGGDIFLQAIGLGVGEQRTARGFIASASQYLENRKHRARKMFSDATPRPANLAQSNELLVARIHILETLFDGMNNKNLLPRIEKEMEEGDTLSKYLCRGGEGWLPLYLETRKVSELDWIYAVRAHAGILEGDLIKSCDEMLTLPPLITRFEETQKSIESAFQSLALEILGWTPKSQPFQTNSLADLPDSCPVTAGQMRAEIRKLTQGRSGFFNDHL